MIRFWKTGFIYFLCLGIVCTGFSTPSARAEGESITIETVDPVTEKPIPSSLLHPGMKVKLVVHAFDAAGKAISCTPNFGKEQGVAGEQIRDVDASGIMEMGSGFGTAEVKASCAEIPNVHSKLMVTNNTLKAPKPSVFDKTEAPAETPPATITPAAGAAASSGAAAGGVLLGILGAGAVVGLAVALAKPKFPCADGERYCNDAKVCCPGDRTMFCETPASVKGCYTDTFAVPYPTCTIKVFCGFDVY